MTESTTHAVAVVGAGPAGLFATRALAAAGCRVLLLNRDIKPGGVAEYGIFITKCKMKGGLRRQFRKILTDPRVTYLGHVAVDESGPLSVPALRAAGFDALVFAIGAQGTKYLGIEGERLPGVYHAKDLVYHYNRLPPFSERHFPMGRRVAIVGVGNVMVDIANYCAHFCECQEIIAVARRGPHEKAYDDREFEDVEDAFDRDAYRREVERIRPRLEAAGQSADVLLKALAARAEAEDLCRARLTFRFLASPQRVITEGGRVVGLEIEETRLARKGERISAVGTGEISRIPCDTVVFAVGDRVDESVGRAYREGLDVEARRAGARDGEGRRDHRAQAIAGSEREGIGAPGRPRPEERAARQRRVHQADERGQARCEKHGGGPTQPPIDDAHEGPTPQERRHDEAISESEKVVVGEAAVTGQIRRALSE